MPKPCEKIDGKASVDGRQAVEYWQLLHTLIFLSMDILQSVDLTVALLYLVLAGAFLLVVPAALYFYLNTRWYVASSFERAFMYFLVFMFFPGLLLLAPFLNFRPKRREVAA